MKRLIVFIISICLLGLATSARAGDPLLKTLQNKGVINEEEASALMAEQEKEKRSILPKALEGLSIGGVAYIDYSAGTKGGESFNEFSLKRGYLNIKKDITTWLKTRITPDVTLIEKKVKVGSEEGDNPQKGDISLRMKYYYVDLLLQDYGLLTDNDLRAGLAQIPWLDFQEAINIYRLQGTMFQERFGNFNSADVGLGLLGNFGGKLSKDLQETVGYPSPYSGRYGSYHVGVYNGGGYHATEDNQNKVIEGRISLRPIPDVIPGLQLTYFGLSGKGNKITNPEWRNNAAFISYQNRLIVLTGEYVQAKGNQKGDDTKDRSGYSIFGDFRLPGYEKMAVMARYDVWDPDTDSGNNKQDLFIGGISYKIYSNNYVLVAYERSHDDAKTEDDKKGQVVFQVSF